MITSGNWGILTRNEAKKEICTHIYILPSFLRPHPGMRVGEQLTFKLKLFRMYRYLQQAIKKIHACTRRNKEQLFENETP